MITFSNKILLVGRNDDLVSPLLFVYNKLLWQILFNEYEELNMVNLK